MSELKIAEILLVEDEDADIDYVLRAFSKAKFKNHIHVAKNGIEALSYLRRENEHVNRPRVDLILLDLNMPILSGHETLKIIKEDPEFRVIPVTIMTSSDREEDICKCYEHHANCYVQKPVDGAKVSKIVETLENFWFSIVLLDPKRN